MADYQSSHRVAGTAASPGRALDTIAMCLVSTLVVAALYRGRVIFQPIVTRNLSDRVPYTTGLARLEISFQTVGTAIKAGLSSCCLVSSENFTTSSG